jgi:membrane associated rhomboid family serine protease
MGPNWIEKLERRYGDWAFPGLPAFIVAANALVYVLTLIKPAFPRLLMLDPQLVWSGEVWRVLTFLVIPPMVSPLWIIFALYLLFVYASQLEEEWGAFRFNVFYLIGALATIIASLILGVGLSNVPLNTTIFLAFAALFPDFELLLFFILPVKVIWLAYIAWAGIVLSMLTGGPVVWVALAAGTLNYWIFFGAQHLSDVRGALDRRRNRKRYKKAFEEPTDED